MYILEIDSLQHYMNKEKCVTFPFMSRVFQNAKRNKNLELCLPVNSHVNGRPFHTGECSQCEGPALIQGYRQACDLTALAGFPLDMNYTLHVYVMSVIYKFAFIRICLKNTSVTDILANAYRSGSSCKHRLGMNATQEQPKGSCSIHQELLSRLN